ncbi:hypothetical protein J40TS1_18130 [Paenibacillus montaniterrae]|uniref:Uncharacterized protein n=1 Tax=Paenibacillus montaniterrae TaxID=429341 RepID=A0A919YPZ0_9BACL|nr:hypothetical protein [Paenibacillus montaniterrae]GIP16171.1 hypothetical protein J40TS1_18130 [Paenibacillus montaniterrae]
MRKIIMGILIACLYCFPFVYFSMHQDFENRSMLGYLLMIVVTVLLAILGKLFSSSLFIIIGNIFSLILSFYFISEMAGNAEWSGYFKPLSPNQFLLLVSILNLIPQLMSMLLAKKFTNKVKD